MAVLVRLIDPDLLEKGFVTAPSCAARAYPAQGASRGVHGAGGSLLYKCTYNYSPVVRASGVDETAQVPRL